MKDFRLTRIAWAHVLSALLLVNLTALVAVSQSLTFAVVGDTGEEGKDQRAIAAQMNNYRNTKGKFDSVLLLGDNIYPDGIGKGLEKEFALPFKALLDAGVKFYAVLGNHDIREEEGWKAQVNYPKFNMGGRRFYSFKMGDGLVEFFALDSTALSEEAEELVLKNMARLERAKATTERSLRTMRSGAAINTRRSRLARVNSQMTNSQNFLTEMRAAKSEQLQWLEEELPRSNARWKIVFLHHAIYSSAYKRSWFKGGPGHGKDKGVLKLRALLKDRFMDSKVDVVFAGHDHVMEKTKAQKSPTTGHQITYLTVGGGSKLRKGDLDKKKSPFFEFGEDSKYSFLVVRLGLQQMNLDVIDTKGKNIFPTFSISKP
ncbi:MAG TPA: metallophosphoesterase [Pyrinomonadaceae bacterium]|nr:metallophosphoesterase [Pyrinomonadaceae bacterium]